MAAGNSNKASAEQLLNAGCDVNAVTTGGLTPLHLAADAGYVEVVALLLDKGANVSPIGVRRATYSFYSKAGCAPLTAGRRRDARSKRRSMTRFWATRPCTALRRTTTWP